MPRPKRSLSGPSAMLAWTVGVACTAAMAFTIGALVGGDEAGLPAAVVLEPRAPSDSDWVRIDAEEREEEVFEEEMFNDVIGIGGGAGGKFGGRYGGRRSLRASGGRARRGTEGEGYAEIDEHGFRLTAIDQLTTFSIDVDTASYSNVRRFLRDGQRPPADAVRVEELLNYFSYADPVPTGDEPFAVSVEIASCPWQPEHRLARVGISTVEIAAGNRPPANLVFLVDVSGSMSSADKLPLLKRGMQLLADTLSGRDRVAIVVYAGAAGLALPSTVCTSSTPVRDTLEQLEAGGSTAGGAGIELAYEIATQHFIEGGINRVILATDGDFNVGISDRDALSRLIFRKTVSGVFLTVLGFGTGNLKDDKLEALADEGNGHYAYIDDIHEARKVLVEEIGATLQTVAKDVKLQVAFHPGRVVAHRLIGYENRRLEHAEFEDDKKDAGEIGAGHGVTALFELVPVGGEVPELDSRGADPDATSAASQPVGQVIGGESILRVDVRYKEPDGDTSRLTSVAALDRGLHIETASDDLRFAAAVAWFGELLRRPRDAQAASDASELLSVRRLAATSRGADESGHRARFIELVERAMSVAPPESD